ncbi:MAG TPA: proteasome subunit beta [Thermoprotei archaeon]|nr:proteasome subunit beta [Thermoprotei archaeon]
MKEVLSTGTTTLAIRCKDGVVLAADTRVTAGYFIAHKHGRKIFSIRPNIAITIAGVVADAQVLLEQVRYHINLFENTYGKPLGVKAIANYLSNVLFAHKLLPFITEMIVAGKDMDGYKVYKLDPLGSIIEDRFAVSGSGSLVAIGVLENRYKEESNIEECVKLALDALLAAMRRDIGSGDDFLIALIDDKGYRELSVKEKEEILKDLGIRT